MIIWTSGLVLLFGTIGAAFMLQPPSSYQIHASVGPAKSGRAPSSVSHSTAFVVKPERILSQAVDLTIPCPANKLETKQEEKSVVEAGVKQVRISGPSCVKGDELASTEVLNSANGFSATVFYPNAKSFTTDYISLAKGINRIRILHIYKKGARIEREFSVERSEN